MERITSKPIVAFVVLLLFAAAVTTASSQIDRKITPIDKRSIPASEKTGIEKVSHPTTGAVTEIDKARNKAIELTFIISDVQVTPGSRNVIISFKSIVQTKPVIEIGKLRPTADANGNLSFSPQAGAFARFVPLENGRYKLDLEAQGEQLESKTTYYYLINLFDGNKKRYQDIGSFTTSPQRVTAKVIFTDLRLFTEALDLASLYHAKYFFFFDVNVDYPGLLRDCFCLADWFYHVPGRRLLGTVKTTDYSGTSFEPVTVELPKGKITLKDEEVVIDNPPDDFLIVAQGLQDAEQPPRNSNSTQSYTTFAQVVAGRASSQPPNGPYGTPAGYYNVARGHFNLSRFPGDRASIPFTLASQRLTPGNIDGYLAFEISGRIEVTRQ